MNMRKVLTVIFFLPAFISSAAMLKFTGEGDILNKTCTLPFNVRNINVGNIDYSEIKQAKEGERLRQSDESIVLINCPDNTKEVKLNVQFKPYKEHPLWIEPDLNPYTGVLLGLAKSIDGEAMSTGDVIVGQVDSKTRSVLLPIFINVYSHHSSGSGYSPGESTSTAVFTLLGE